MRETRSGVLQSRAGSRRRYGSADGIHRRPARECRLRARARTPCLPVRRRRIADAAARSGRPAIIRAFLNHWRCAMKRLLVLVVLAGVLISVNVQAQCGPPLPKPRVAFLNKVNE